MAIRKRGNSYQIDYIDPNGKRVRKSFKKKNAVVELGKRVSLIVENRYLDVKKEYKTTLGELLSKYEENHKHQPSWKTHKSGCIKDFRKYFGKVTIVSNIRYIDVETYRNHLTRKSTQHGTIREISTVNRQMGVLHHVFEKAVEWDLGEGNPFDCGGSLFEKEDNIRERYLKKEQIESLLKELEHLPYLRRIVVFALNTGGRRGEILNLKWKQIKDDYIIFHQTKTKNKVIMPINDEVAQVLTEILSELRETTGSPGWDDYVFTRYGEKIKRVDRAFGNALDKVGIEDFSFHDLRHTFASHLAMKGATMKEIQELLGHKDIKTTMRYAHLADENKRRAVSLLNGLTSKKEEREEQAYAKPDMSQNVTSQQPAFLSLQYPDQIS